MKTMMILSILTLCLNSAAFAKTPAQCANTAKGAAQDYMAQILDEECANPSATIERATVSGSQIKYEVDVVCGPASVRANHHSQEVVVDENSCTVISGGGGDA